MDCPHEGAGGSSLAPRPGRAQQGGTAYDQEEALHNHQSYGLGLLGPQAASNALLLCVSQSVCGILLAALRHQTLLLPLLSLNLGLFRRGSGKGKGFEARQAG